MHNQPNAATPVLVVIDVQTGFVTAHSKHVVEPIIAAAQAWVHHGRHVVLTRFLNPEAIQWERLMHWTRMRSAPDTDLVDGLVALHRAHPDLVHVVDKRSYSAVYEVPVSMTTYLGAGELALCGIDTDACVLATAIDVFSDDHTPFVLEDLCSSSGGQVFHEAGMLLLRRLLGPDQVVSSNTYLERHKVDPARTQT